jgi:hypothetical protein
VLSPVLALTFVGSLAGTSVGIPPGPFDAGISTDPRIVGRWSAPFWEGGEEPYDPASKEKAKKYPVGAAVSVLPDGRVLYWNALEGSENADAWIANADFTLADENARVRILDVGSGTPSWSTSKLERGTTDLAFDTPTGPSQDLFCSDQKLLHDGTVLVAGGTEWKADLSSPQDSDAHGLRDTRIFDPTTDEFRQVDDMTEPRWYPSLVTLADGRVFVASGVRRVVFSPLNPGTSFDQVRLNEIYDPGEGTWEDAGTSDLSFPLYPRLHLLPDGTVFYGGAGQAWGPAGETPDQGAWAVRRVYDPDTKEWSVVGLSPSGVRSGAAATLLKLEPPYDRADILMAGGTVGVAPGGYAATTLSEVVRWTPGGIETVAPTPGAVSPDGGLGQLNNPRWFGVPVMLPTGEVFLTNGGDTDDTLYPGSAGPVRTPELYDPERGIWSELAPAERDRVYHHSAALLPDGRVLVGGHSPHPASFFQHGETVARRNDFKDATFEVYEPPYLFRGPRPVIDGVVPTAKGRNLALILGRDTSAQDISEVNLVRLGSNTHSMDGDMRAVKLEHSVSGSVVFASLPKGGDGRILPPGPYYVFAMTNTPDGPVPSVAQTVLIQPDGEGKVVASAS